MHVRFAVSDKRLSSITRQYPVSKSENPVLSSAECVGSGAADFLFVVVSERSFCQRARSAAEHSVAYVDFMSARVLFLLCFSNAASQQRGAPPGRLESCYGDDSRSFRAVPGCPEDT